MTSAARTTAQPAAAAPVRIAARDSAEEREADRIADAVLRGTYFAAPAPPSGPPASYRQCAACAAGGTPCADCNEDDTRGLLLRRAGPAVEGGAAAAAAQVRDGGRPLPSA